MAEGEENKKTLQFILGEVEELKRVVANMAQVQSRRGPGSASQPVSDQVSHALLSAVSESITSAIKSSLDMISKMMSETRERDFELVKLAFERRDDDGDYEEDDNGKDQAKLAMLEKLSGVAEKLLQNGLKK